MEATKPLASMATYPKLAAHTFIGLDETILVVHHGTVLLFTSGVVTKNDGDRLFLLQWLRRVNARMDPSLKTAKKSRDNTIGCQRETTSDRIQQC